MFETLFHYPGVIARHRAAPFAEARERFLNHCINQGLAGPTVLRYARELLVIAERIDVGQAVDLSTIAAAADRWAGRAAPTPCARSAVVANALCPDDVLTRAVEGKWLCGAHKVASIDSTGVVGGAPHNSGGHIMQSIFSSAARPHSVGEREET